MCVGVIIYVASIVSTCIFMWRCDHPGLECVHNKTSGYTDQAKCTAYCATMAPDTDPADGSRVASYKTDFALLQAMIRVYSRGMLRLEMQDGSVRATAMRDIAYGDCIMTAPAGIVGSGDLTDTMAIILTLPKLMHVVEGFTQLALNKTSADDAAREFDDLFPPIVLKLARGVQRNAVLLPNNSYAVSVPFAIMPHDCSGNAVGIVGSFPVQQLLNGEVDGGVTTKRAPGMFDNTAYNDLLNMSFGQADLREVLSEKDKRALQRSTFTGSTTLLPALAIFASADIKRGEAVTVRYGNCDTLTSQGFACSAGRLASKKCPSNSKEAVETLAGLMTLIKTRASPKNFLLIKKPNVRAPEPWADAIEDRDFRASVFAENVARVINAVRVKEYEAKVYSKAEKGYVTTVKQEPVVSLPEAQAIVEMWYQNRMNGPRTLRSRRVVKQ